MKSIVKNKMKFRDNFIESAYETARTVLQDLNIPGSIEYNKRYTKYNYPITFGSPGIKMSLVIETPSKDILVRYRRGHAKRISLSCFQNILRVVRTLGPDKTNKVHGVFLAKSFYNPHELAVEDIRRATGVELVIDKTEEGIIENFGKRLSEILTEQGS